MILLKLLATGVVSVILWFDVHMFEILDDALERNGAGLVGIIYLVSTITCYISIWGGSMKWFLISLGIMLLLGFVPAFIINVFKYKNIYVAGQVTVISRAIPWWMKLLNPIFHWIPKGI